MKSLHSLLVTTSTEQMDDSGNKTGVWLEDLAAPYFILKDRGETVTIASPAGGKIPLDLNSQSMRSVTLSTKRFQDNAQAMYQYNHSIPLNEIDCSLFDLVFIAGGYGALLDFPDNICLHLLIQQFYDSGKPIGLVGYAVAALLKLTNEEGHAFVKGKNITAFSNREEKLVALNEKSPFSLEDRLVDLGALYHSGPDFKSYVVTEDHILTGQNPASANDLARAVIAVAKKDHSGI